MVAVNAYPLEAYEKGPTRAWAILNKNGALMFLTFARDEESVWTWYLGWPDESEIAAARQRGMRCVQVNVTENK